MRTLFILLTGLGVSALWSEKPTVSKTPAPKSTHHYAVLIRTSTDARQLQADVNQYLNGQLADTYAGSYVGDSLVYSKVDVTPSGQITMAMVMEK